jgi:hypothetical protein
MAVQSLNQRIKKLNFPIFSNYNNIPAFPFAFLPFTKYPRLLNNVVIQQKLSNYFKFPFFSVLCVQAFPNLVNLFKSALRRILHIKGGTDCIITLSGRTIRSIEGYIGIPKFFHQLAPLGLRGSIENVKSGCPRNQSCSLNRYSHLNRRWIWICRKWGLGAYTAGKMSTSCWFVI